MPVLYNGGEDKPSHVDSLWYHIQEISSEELYESSSGWGEYARPFQPSGLLEKALTSKLFYAILDFLKVRRSKMSASEGRNRQCSTDMASYSEHLESSIEQGDLAMANEHILLHIAIILVFSKLIASLCLRLKLPPVVGYIIFGIITGPMVLGVLEEDVVISWLSKVGVIMLLFEAGLETELSQVKRQGLLSFLAAGGGVIIPFGLGFGLCSILGKSIATSAMVGTILTATSVGVTTMTLVDLKSLRTPEGTTILSAAIIDDLVGIILLTIITGLVEPGGALSVGLLEMAGYFVIAILMGILLIPLIVRLTRKLDVEYGMVSIALALAFLFAWGAERVHAAEITGAYLAGLFFGRTVAKREVMEGIWSMGQTLFVSIFFVEIGLKMRLHLSDLHWGLLGGLLLVAIAGKILGSGLGARIGGMSKSAALCVGIGMVPRGEVCLIIASLGLKMGIIEHFEFSAAVIIVVITAIVTPIGLKWGFRGDKGASTGG